LASIKKGAFFHTGGAVPSCSARKCRRACGSFKGNDRPDRSRRIGAAVATLGVERFDLMGREWRFNPARTDRMQGPLAELRADDEVENAGAELVADAPHLREHGVRAADDHLAERAGQSGAWLTGIWGNGMSHAQYLRLEAERCFRLARGPAGPRLVDELEAWGRAEGYRRPLVVGAPRAARSPSHGVGAGRAVR
jgi:hypothetical protein